MPSFRRALCALAFLWVSSIADAAAHAYVVGAQPPANSGNQHWAGFVSVSFDEPIDLIDANALKVFAPDGKRIDEHDVKVDPADATRIVAHVPSILGRGVYTVRWRVISADSHVVHGMYRIGIGVPVVGISSNEPASPYDPGLPLASLLRWLSLMGALLTGGAVFLRLRVLDELELEFPGATELARRCTIAGAVMVLGAWGPTVVVQAAAASGAIGNGIAATLLHTAWGITVLVRAAVALELLLAACVAWKTTARVAALLVAVLLATFSLTGHALSQPAGFPRAVAFSIDLAHLGAAAIWIGGVFVLVILVALDPRGMNRQHVRTLFSAFTPIAALCVGIILATGIYASANHLTSASDFVTTDYGRLLLAKIAVLAILLAFGWHHFRVGANARSNNGNATILYEGFWGIVVVALSASLVGQAPPASAFVLPDSPTKMILALMCIGIVARFMLFAKTTSTVKSNARAITVPLNAMLIVAAVLFMGTGVLGRLVDISSASMYPTLQLGDVVFVDQVTYRLRAPHDGEVVVFRSPILPGAHEVAQRVIGVGGERVEIEDGVVYRNGATVHEPYVHEPAAYDLTIRDYEIYVDGAPLDPSLANVPPKGMWQFPNRIPQGFYFVLGDNRNYSVDSHFWGFAQAGGTFAAGPLRAQPVAVPGKPLFVMWPPKRTHLVEGS